MDLETLRTVLLWCTLLNYGVLLLWFMVLKLARPWLRQLHGRWFSLSEAQFDAIHYGLMGVYKLGILLLNLIPCVALHLAA